MASLRLSYSTHSGSGAWHRSPILFILIPVDSMVGSFLHMNDKNKANMLPHMHTPFTILGFHDVPQDASKQVSVILDNVYEFLWPLQAPTLVSKYQPNSQYTKPSAVSCPQPLQFIKKPCRLVGSFYS